MIEIMDPNCVESIAFIVDLRNSNISDTIEVKVQHDLVVIII